MTTATEAALTELRGDLSLTARRIEVPPAVRRLSSLSRVDYEDAFLIETPAAHGLGAEQWARATLEGASTTAGGRLWSSLAAVGLLPRAGEDGSTRSDRIVGGWELRRGGRDVALLGASARVGLSAELLFKRGEHSMLWATFVQFKNPIARAAWAGLSPVHRRVVPRLLERVGRRSARDADR